MHCVYCGVDYSPEEPCMCLPPVREGKAEPMAKVSGPWGEAAAEWSAKPHTASERGKSGLISC
jgi:hypothetical protein